MDYLYRFDMLQRLREQSDDPHLRARRVTKVTGQFDHHQVVGELVRLREGDGIYRFCFWKNWEAAVKHMHVCSAGGSPWVLQRIRANHPVFAKFERGDDEYLKDDAWIFWHTSRVDSARPDWSPEGISHDDIEVLTPEGQWERLSTSSLMRDASFDGWRLIATPGSPHPTPVLTRALVRSDAGKPSEIWVLIRQTPGPWKTVWLNPRAVSDVVSQLFPDFSYSGLHQVRWVVSLECKDRVLSAEVFPTVRARPQSLLQKLFPRSYPGRPDYIVDVGEQFVSLDQRTQKALYRDFGIGDVLLLERRYEYSAGVLNAAGIRRANIPGAASAAEAAAAATSGSTTLTDGSTLI